jgi:hypothetical protein
MSNANFGLNKAESILNGNAPVTATAFQDLQQSFINALSPGGAATEGKVNRDSITTLQGMLNHLQQTFGDSADLRVSDPGTIAQLTQLIHQVHEDYGDAYNKRVEEIRGNYKYNQDPGIRNTANDKADSLLNTRGNSSTTPVAPVKTRAQKIAELQAADAAKGQ